jgi:hypothetical protein
LALGSYHLSSLTTVAPQVLSLGRPGLILFERVPFGAQLVDFSQHPFQQGVRRCARYPEPLKLYFGSNVIEVGAWLSVIANVRYREQNVTKRQAARSWAYRSEQRSPAPLLRI